MASSRSSGKVQYHCSFCGKNQDQVKRLIAGEPVSQEDSGLPKREWRELMADLEREG